MKLTRWSYSNCKKWQFANQISSERFHNFIDLRNFSKSTDGWTRVLWINQSEKISNFILFQNLQLEFVTAMQVLGSSFSNQIGRPKWNQISEDKNQFCWISNALKSKLFVAREVKGTPKNPWIHIHGIQNMQHWLTN